MQDPVRKPGVGVWARKLPVWGIYGRRIARLRLEDVTLKTTDADDARPVIAVEDVGQLTLDNLRHPPLPAGARVVERRGR